LDEEEQAPTMTRPPAPIRHLKTIENHIEKHFGSDYFVLHEKKSNIVHVDIHIVRPSPARPFLTLLTSGMSDLDMHTPDGLENLALAELCLCLPAEWPLSLTNLGWREPRYFWPINFLQQSARYPHRHKTWFSWGHVVEGLEGWLHADAGVNFTGMLLLRPRTFPTGADKLTTEDGRVVHFLAIVPILPEEIVFDSNNDSGELEERLCAVGVSEIVEPQRASVV
jgi:Suppressor of fused protein (SUFU)